jgi:enoyl-CoA hydratase/carnithine racemase
MQDFEHLILELKEQVWLIRFNRPEQRNPLSIEALRQLQEITTRISMQPGVKRLIFTGTDDVFASGADLREISGIIGAAAREFGQMGQNLMNKIAALPQETTALVNGYCFGGAFDLALACRKRIATEKAVFCHPGPALGIMTGWGGTQRLPRLVGEAKAIETFLTGKRIAADEAIRIGLVDKIISTAEYLEITSASFDLTPQFRQTFPTSNDQRA